MTEVFMSAGLREYSQLVLCIIEVVVCGVAPHKTVIILSFYDVVLTFPKLGCWPGTVTLIMIYCVVEYMLHY